MAEHPMFSQYVQDQLREAIGGLAESTATPVMKLGVTLPVSEELLMDHGIIPDTRPPAPPIPRLRRARWAVSDWVWRQRRRAASKLAGFDVEEDRW